jgi:hypothetical protein
MWLNFSPETLPKQNPTKTQLFQTFFQTKTKQKRQPVKVAKE